VPSSTVVSRKPITVRATDSPARAMDGKALPPSPPGVRGRDIVDALQEKANELEKRRWNVEKHIRELESPQHQNPLQYDIKSRRQIDKRIAALKSQVEDLRREEHDNGIKLHRAWRKRDDGEEHTSLWVKRIAT
jgi:hypothetical protein